MIINKYRYRGPAAVQPMLMCTDLRQALLFAMLSSHICEAAADDSAHLIKLCLVMAFQYVRFCIGKMLAKIDQTL